MYLLFKRLNILFLVDNTYLIYVLALIPKKLDLLHVYAYFVSLNISKIQSAQLQSKDLDAVSIKQDIHCLVYK
jgi:hypothetical protein